MAYQLKTKETETDVEAFIAAVESPTRREDARTLVALMSDVTGERPRMWGPTIIGFGAYRYRYKSGHEGEMCRIGFSPRKGALSLYIRQCENPQDGDMLSRLGKHKLGQGGCLYVNKLADVDMSVVREMVEAGWKVSEPG